MKKVLDADYSTRRWVFDKEMDYVISSKAA